ncbi:isochorismatase family protein [Streptomyces sp. NPDC004129]
MVVAGLLAETCVEATARFAMELGCHVMLVRDATAALSPERMQAAHEPNGPTCAHGEAGTESRRYRRDPGGASLPYSLRGPRGSDRHVARRLLRSRSRHRLAVARPAPVHAGTQPGRRPGQDRLPEAAGVPAAADRPACFPAPVRGARHGGIRCLLHVPGHTGPPSNQARIFTGPVALRARLNTAYPWSCAVRPRSRGG